MKPQLVEQTFRLGEQHWRYSGSAGWSVLMFGWWPWSNGTPSYQWRSIDTKDVPKSLREKV